MSKKKPAKKSSPPGKDSHKKRTKFANFKGKANTKPFTEKNQPPGEVKSLGWKRKQFGQELARNLLRLDFAGNDDGKTKAAAARYFNLNPDDMTVELLMLFKQIERAIDKSDTQAFRAFMERAYGAPKEFIDHTSGGDKISALNVNVIDAATKKEIEKLTKQK